MQLLLKIGADKLKILRIAIPTASDGVLRNSSRRIFSHRLKLSPTLKDGVILKRYNLMNQNYVMYKHPGMIQAFGWGIEVNDDYRNRNIGHCLLSVVVRIAQLDF